jgi:hypothetical protein
MRGIVKIDGKFSCDGKRIYNTVSGETFPEDEPRFLLRARDRNALETLRDYRLACENDGCNDLHLAAIDKNIKAFEQFFLDHPERMKEPGVTRHVQL